MDNSLIFKPFKIKDVEFKNRIIRSSMGGRTAYYSGEINPAWINFESIFAKNHLGGIISPTLTVDEQRWSPLEFPKLSRDEFIDPFKRGLSAVKEAAIKATGEDCKYIMQLGDGGYHTQASLFSQHADSMSPSGLFDLFYGYRNKSNQLSIKEIKKSIKKFAQAAKRVQDIGCDGLEITASKGYLIHQFLNPATNRRKDAYGGSTDKRFQFLREIIEEVHEHVNVNNKFLFGIRISARDFNYLPFPNVRLPFSGGVKGYFFGNDLEQTLHYGQELEKLGIDYLHISNGFGFINPKENPGDFPVREVRMLFNSVRHLSAKSLVRATLLNMLPHRFVRWLYGWGWVAHSDKVDMNINADDAAAFKRTVNIPIIGNGGFQSRAVIESALNTKCDMVAMARPLLANPELVMHLKDEGHPIGRPCSFCNRCAVRTSLFPVGCYDERRYYPDGKPPTREQMEDVMEEMEANILKFNQPPEF